MKPIACTAFLGLFAVSVSASTIVVNSTADPGAPGICALRDAIAAANTDTAVNGCSAGHGTDAIDLTGVAGAIGLAAGELLISSNLNIIGPGAATLAVDGGGAPSTTLETAMITRVTIAGLTVANGGGILNKGRLVLTNCSVSDIDEILTTGTLTVDSCALTGGEILVESGRLTVRRTAFSNSNESGIRLFGGVASIADSSFSTPSGSSGAAIFNSSGIITVTNCAFLNNQSSLGGGAIGNQRRMLVTGCTFSGNHATTGGGAIFNDNSAKVGNRLMVRGSTFTGNSSAFDGGAIHNHGNLRITNSTFENNSAATTGGAIASSAGPTQLTNTTFAGNSAATGGALFFDPSTCGAGPCIMSFRNSIVANSSGAPNCSGPITNRRGNLDSDASCGDGPATDPLLDPAGLADHGGPTQTIALQATSPAINAGSVGCPRTDQRGYLRPGTGATHCSIGAFEANSPGCPSNLSTCGPMNICANLRTDADNCGACGTVCPAAQTCWRGVCS